MLSVVAAPIEPRGKLIFNPVYVMAILPELAVYLRGPSVKTCFIKAFGLPRPSLPCYLFPAGVVGLLVAFLAQHFKVERLFAPKPFIGLVVHL